VLLEVELPELQQQLAQVDLLTEPRPRGRPDIIEFLVLKRRDLKIKMYRETGHYTPHVHVDYGRDHHVASYSIVEARRLAGMLDGKYDRVVVDWIMKYRARLLDVWNTAQVGRDPRSLIAEISGDA
jgi:hypothetical protein